MTLHSRIVVDMLAPDWRAEPTKLELIAQLRWFIEQYERLIADAPKQIEALRNALALASHESGYQARKRLNNDNTRALANLERELADAHANLPIARAELAELEAPADPHEQISS